MSDHRALGCAFCGEELASDECIASIRIASRVHGQRFFAAHVECFKRTIRAESANLIDLSDVPAGMDHFLMLPA